LRSYLAEFVVIVLGILLAFQVEEWRDERAEQRDVAAAMQRLLEETDENIQLCLVMKEMLKSNAMSVQHVYQSLTAGEIIQRDEKTFELGLTNFDVVPDIRLLTSVANEMISTGLLKEVDDRELRGSIARLPSLDAQAGDMLVYWRTPIIELHSELTSLVDYYYAGDIPSLDRSDPFNEAIGSSMRVNYDFQELANNRIIRNQFYDAVDVHADLWFGFQERCSVVEEIKRGLKDAILTAP